ncbi:MAG: hypothetical protein HOO96_34975 [Polyangiaceae bacterium]|nr:hypothetical protein [Polyangiaceae bacterium]
MRSSFRPSLFALSLFVSLSAFACGGSDAGSGSTSSSGASSSSGGGSSSGASSSSSSGGSSGAAAALPDPCTLISAAEIESLLGAPIVGEPLSASTPGGDVRRCTWKRKYSPELRTDEIALSVAQASAYASTGPSALVGASPYAIGDEGQLLDQSRGVQIAWKKGPVSASFRYSLIGGFTGDFEALRTRAKELAGAANGRL